MLTFRVFLVRPLQSTRDWARAHGFRSSADGIYQAALQKGRQEWILKEPCSRSDLVVTKYANSKEELFRLPAQGWDRRVAEDAARRLRGTRPPQAPLGRRTLRRQPAVDVVVLAERVASELETLRAEVVSGSKLLYDRLPVHSLGEGQLCIAVCEHLDRPCIGDAPLLLGELADAAGVDVTALRRSAPGLAQRLDCLAEAVQDAVQESHAFWTELAETLAERHAARPARTRVVRTSQCLHRGKRKLLV